MYRPSAAATAAVLLILGISVPACSRASNTTAAASSTSVSRAVSSTSSPKATTPSSSATAPRSAVDPNAPEASDPGDIPDNQQFVDWAPPGGGWSVKVPEGWARTDLSQGATFTDKFNSIRAEESPSVTAPTVASARATEVSSLEHSEAGFKLGNVTTVRRAAGDAVLITWFGESPPNQVTGKSIVTSVERYEFWRGGVVVSLTLSGAKGADNVDPWKTVTEGFRWTT